MNMGKGIIFILSMAAALLGAVAVAVVRRKFR